nr:ABC transporter transmembrane domain-containing protein [Angustibacter aerolatus]
MALREDLGLSWLMGVSVPVLAVSIGLVARRMVPGFRSMQVRIDAVNWCCASRSPASGWCGPSCASRSSGSGSRGSTASLTETATAVGRLTALMFPIVMLVLNVSSVAVLWFGGHRIADGQMQVGALTAFLSYLLQILMSVMMATFVLVMVPRAAVCAERIEEVLGTASSVVPPAVPVRPPGRGADLVLDHVGFTYPGADAPVLRDVTLTARAGQTTAVVGSTGSGKTTLVQPGAAVDGRDHRRGAARRRRRARPRTGRPVGPHRAGAAAAVPVWRHRREQPAAGRARRHGRRERGPRSTSRRRGTSSRRWRRGCCRPSPRAARTCRAGSGSGWRSLAPWCGVRPSTCSTTRSARSTCAPTPGCAPRCGRRRRQRRAGGRPTGVDRRRRRPDRGARGRRGGRPGPARRPAGDLPDVPRDRRVAA